jgi:hypothetical protein
MIRSLPGIFLLLLLLSCENEVRINRNDPPVPVAYCILDLDDSVQFVRLARSFLPDSGSTAQEHPTLENWNEPVEIYMEEWVDAGNPKLYDFTPVDTVRQDTGFFSRPSFSLYQSEFRPLPGVTYYLYLWFPDRGYHAFATTTTVEKPQLINPVAVPGRKITFSDPDDFIVEFRSPAHSGYHQFSFILTIEETLNRGFDLNYFEFGSQSVTDNSDEVVVALLNSARFYDNLLQRYDTLGTGEFRRITGTEFVLCSYGNELRLYNQLYNNGAQPWEIQSYSSFRNGFGLFSSRARARVANLELSDLTWQILTSDARYTHLKFVR